MVIAAILAASSWLGYAVTFPAADCVGCPDCDVVTFELAGLLGMGRVDWDGRMTKVYPLMTVVKIGVISGSGSVVEAIGAEAAPVWMGAALLLCQS